MLCGLVIRVQTMSVLSSAMHVIAAGITLTAATKMGAARAIGAACPSHMRRSATTPSTSASDNA